MIGEFGLISPVITFTLGNRGVSKLEKSVYSGAPLLHGFTVLR